MAIQNISALPDAPTPADSAEDFANKAAAFVPALSTFQEEINQFGEDVVNEVTTQVESAQDYMNITANGLFEAVVIGDTDGINAEFDVLSSSFYPYWMLFIDGVKVSSDEITISGTSITLSSAPSSGATIEAFAPRSTDFIAPDGFKTLAFLSKKDGDINITCSSNGSTPQFSVNEAVTETTSFSYTNDGSYVYVFLYVPDDASIVEIDAGDADLYDVSADYGLNVSKLELSDNDNLTSFESLSNISGLTTLRNMFFRSANFELLPYFDASAVTTAYRAFYSCRLLEFPSLDLSNCLNFNTAFFGNNFTSFPFADYSSSTDFRGAWLNCSSLESFPSGFFDNVAPNADYLNAFRGCALSEESVDNILVSINNSGASNVFIDIYDGTSSAPSATGLAAQADLESRGCTVTTN